jgi:DNA polymerase-3 subunit alpha
MIRAMFAHLRLHTEYSMVDSTIRLKPLIARAAALGLPALAITDDSIVSGYLKFFKEAEAAGIKPILGADVLLHCPQHALDTPPRLTLLAMDHGGYQNLSRLLTGAYRHRQRGSRPLVDEAALFEQHAGLIVLSGGIDGVVGQLLAKGQDERAEAVARRCAEVFGDRYVLELSRCGRSGEAEITQATAAIAARLGIPAVATNDVRFLAADDFESHEARVAIANSTTLADPRRPQIYTREQYLKSAAEMAALFADLPGAIDNTLAIATRCNFRPQTGTYFLPDYPTPEGVGLDDWLGQSAHAGLTERLKQLSALGVQVAPEATYRERLDIEIGVIGKMGFAGYFLIVADFIQWAKDHGVPVGPGRGSGAGSLVAYALKITDLDPLRYELLFERFLNPERVSMPDFDIDFCMEGRDKVIDYVRDRYGRDHVCQIITHGTMAAKACVRDAGRALGLPFPAVDRIAKLVPDTLGVELPEALGLDEKAKPDPDRYSSDLRQLWDQDEEARGVLELALKLEGLTRNAGKHAGGVVIAPSPVSDFVPLYAENGDDELLAQLDMVDLEKIGLVKFDFLGLRTLTILDWTLQAISASGGPRIDLNALRLDDHATYALLQACRTTAVFQLESRGMKELIRKLKPDCFEDIIALCALFRPGPLQSGMVDDFVDRKHGRQEVSYPHPLLEPVLKPTYGTIVYQEQVMQAAQVLAGYTLGGADLLRRAMGKKDAKEMAKQRAVFVDGSKARGVNPDTAAGIFDLIEKFAEYGFNKSHSAAYALLAYQTAFLKAHFPAEFMAAVLSSDMDKVEKVTDFLGDVRAEGLKLLPPDVNASEFRFRAVDARTIRYGLGAIRGVGQAACEMIVEVRGKGRYRDLSDLCARLDPTKTNKRVYDALLAAGALDGLGPNRATLERWLPEALKAADQQRRDRESGQQDLFGAMRAGAATASPLPAAVPEKPLLDLLKAERQVLGNYLSGHPVDVDRPQLDSVLSGDLGGLLAKLKPERRSRKDDPGVCVLAQAGPLRWRGENVAFLPIEDGRGRVEAVCYSEVCRDYGELLESAKDAVLVFEGVLSLDDYNGQPSFRVRSVRSVEQAIGAWTRQVIVRAAPRDAGFVEHLRNALEPHRAAGRAGVTLALTLTEAELDCELAADWQVAGSLALRDALGALPEVREVSLRLSRRAPAEPDFEPESRA